MFDYYNSEPMKYWSPPSSMPAEVKKQHIEQMINSGEYICAQKIDGNWSRAVLTSEYRVLQTRGISKVTGTYGQIQDKVYFWDAINRAFTNGETVILGEVFLPGKIDKDIGAILRCLKDKALMRQKDTPLQWYIFDVLALDGKNLMNHPVEERIKYIPDIVKRINSPLVTGAIYYQMDETFFDKINDIFRRGGEGMVCYKKDAIYLPGKRGPRAWDSLKVKQEIENTIDCFIIDTVAPEHYYQGDHMDEWMYWEDAHTGEKLYGQYYIQYTEGHTVNPISKNYYHNWPAAVLTGVYDNKGNIIPLCKVAGLTEEMKASLRDWFKSKWEMCPISIGGMMISTAKADNEGLGISVRHPYLKAVRADDIDPKDCTLEKILS